MKIKLAMEQTGLTDRTIRYYIEERLLFPSFTENYLGRKSFDFSQEDINILNRISILRQFDFSIDEIRQIIEDANTSPQIIANLIYRTENSVSVGEEKLRVLSQLSNEQAYTFEQLAEELSKPTIKLPEHDNLDQRNLLKTIISLVKAFMIFAIVWSPVVLSVFGVIVDISDYLYPVFNHTMIALTIASFLPSVGVLVISKMQCKWKTMAQRILLTLCLFSIPISLIFSCSIITRSETSDIRNYRKLDTDCFANRDSFFQDLFPIWPHYFINEKHPDDSYKIVYLDAHYYYCKRPAMDYTYDIYAQWPLEKERFEHEVARVQALFNSHATEHNRQYVTLQKGTYTCLIAYSGDMPFEKVTNSYTYYIFAYDETNLTVRYIMCDSLENGAHQPYYLTLTW